MKWMITAIPCSDHYDEDKPDVTVTKKARELMEQAGILPVELKEVA